MTDTEQEGTMEETPGQGLNSSSLDSSSPAAEAAAAGGGGGGGDGGEETNKAGGDVPPQEGGEGISGNEGGSNRTESADNGNSGGTDRDGSSGRGRGEDDQAVTTRFPKLNVPAINNTKKAIRNPFRMPSDDEIFVMREEERRRKRLERETMKKLRVHEKTTYSSRLNAKSLLVSEPDPELDEILNAKKEASQDLLMMTTKDRRVEKENLTEFIAKKREMFLVQYSLGVKREEMRKLEEIAQAEEQKLLDDEKSLEEDAAKFDAFLKENDKNSVEAIKRAEAETKAKLEKVAEIKKIIAQIMGIKSEMSKNEDQLKEYQMYKEFLDKLTPNDWFEEQKAKKDKHKVERKMAREAERQAKIDAGEILEEKVVETAALEKAHKKGSKSSGIKMGGRRRTSSSKRVVTGGELVKHGSMASSSSSLATKTDDSESEDDDYEEELYFKDPQQLLDIFAELEEQNLSLIQNSQETEEALEELKQKIMETEKKMSKETDTLKAQIDFLELAISKEEEKANSLEERARFFSLGVLGVEDQESELDDLNKKVEEVYRNCIGDNDANISTIQMLTNIENKLEELFEMIEYMPPEKVETAEKIKEKERRQRLREEKLEAQRITQEERVRRALDRAKAPVKKKTGKPLVFRSAPPQKKKREKEKMDKQNENEEEHNFFFS
eukprot:Nk52_evm18s553 gene=Nk52_evmTU18s553